MGQALQRSHFTDEEASLSAWLTTGTLVIVIICPLATPEEVMVTQQLHKNVDAATACLRPHSCGRRQAVAAEAGTFWRWKVKKYHT